MKVRPPGRKSDCRDRKSQTYMRRPEEHLNTVGEREREKERERKSDRREGEKEGERDKLRSVARSEMG